MSSDNNDYAASLIQIAREMRAQRSVLYADLNRKKMHLVCRSCSLHLEVFERTDIRMWRCCENPDVHTLAALCERDS